MSYCRWSSDDWKCDLYCYQDVSGGYTTHVAGNRVVGDIPKCPPFPPRSATKAEVSAWSKAYAIAHAKQMAFLDTAKRIPIGLPHDGEGFNDPDLRSFLARVISLQALGYHVPAWVIESIRDEIKEE